MKFLCIDCDEQMRFEAREQPGDGTFAAAFGCPRCGRRVALLANPMETQLVAAMGVKIGGRTLAEQPMEVIRTTVEGSERAFRDEPEPAAPPRPGPRWSAEAHERLARVPGFVRGMVKRIYADYAAERRIAEITPEVMDRARRELGLEGMQVAGFEERVVRDVRVRIDRTLCVGFGDCVSASPDAFVLDADNVATFAAPESGTRECLLRACASCPVDALTVWTIEGEQLIP